jgi:mannose-6-phosphate isomerase-like protein (cupin superfamily)
VAAKPYTRVDVAGLERAGPKWGLVRRSLGLRAFGMNLIDLAPGEKIPEHDEVGRDQEEVFFVVRGTGAMVIDGEKVPVKAGVFVRVDPEATRTVVNTSARTTLTVLVASAPTTSGYEPMEWA